MRRAFVAALILTSTVALSARAGGQSRIASARPSTPAPGAPAPRQLAVMTAQSLVNIYGRTIDAEKQGVPGAHMRLRNARTGRITGETFTDKTGDFEFLGVDPGMYVAEMVSEQGRLLAAGDILVAEYGQTVATIVRLPVKLSLFNLMRESGAMTEALERSAVSAAAEAGATVAAQTSGAAGGTISTGIFAPTLGTIINVATSAGILTRIPQAPPASPLR